MRRMTNKLLPLVVAAVVAAPAAAQEPEIEDFEFEVTTLDGDELTQEDFKDKVFLVDFWGTWCPPCRQAIPVLSRLYKKYHDRGFAILGLNYKEGADIEKAKAKVQRFARNHGIPYPLAIGSDDIKAQVPDFRGYPTMLLFRRGLVLDRIEVGFSAAHGKRLEKWIEKAIAAPVQDEAADDESEEGADVDEASQSKDGKKPELFLECQDGSKFRVGGHDRFTVLVLVHPRMMLADLKALRGLATKYDRLQLRTVARGDIPGDVADALHIKKTSLAKVRLGKAFPAYLLLSPKGRTIRRTAGRGGSVVADFVKGVEAALEGKKSPKAPTSSPAGKSGKGVPRKVEVPKRR